MTFSRSLAGLLALLALAVGACGSSASTPQDAGGQGALGGTGATVTNTGGSTGTGGPGTGGQATVTGTGGSGTGGAASPATGGVVGTQTDGGASDGSVTLGSGGAGAGGTTGGGGATPGPVAGTISIFDGKTLNGWEQGTTKLWSVVNGAIDGKGTTGGQLLITQADYGDFRIVVSSNLVAKGGTGHLGICFWGGRTPVGGYNKCKLIIPPNGTWDYSLNSGLRGVTKAAGTPVINSGWNTTEILCFLAKGFCRVATNGTAVLTYQEPNLASIKAGPIGVQIHQGTNEEVQYKDIFVDPAPTVDKLLTLK